MGLSRSGTVCRLCLTSLFFHLSRSETRRPMSVNWVAYGTCYTKTEGTELGGTEL